MEVLWTFIFYIISLFFFQLVIDIGHSISAENENRVYYINQVIPEPTAIVE
jgi:hypothetical protein